MTFAAARGLRDHVGDWSRLGLITFDAHHDLRDGISNGSPVRRLVEDGLPGSQIVQIGISDFANSREYAQRARDYGITVIRRDELRSRSMAEVIEHALQVIGDRSVFVDVDVDVCDRSVVPACPAAAPGGLSADELRQLVRAQHAAAVFARSISRRLMQVRMRRTAAQSALLHSEIGRAHV